MVSNVNMNTLSSGGVGGVRNAGGGGVIGFSKIFKSSIKGGVIGFSPEKQ